MKILPRFSKELRCQFLENPSGGSRFVPSGRTDGQV